MKRALLAFLLLTSISGWCQSTNVIVIGFLGGFVHNDEPGHPEIRLMQDIQRTLPDAYVGLFENHKINDAYRIILRLDPNKDARIVLFGHSWGAAAVLMLARKLDKVGIPVTMTIQVDSVKKFLRNDTLVPPNVAQAINFYQTKGLLRGCRKIVAADPKRTEILGNVRVRYGKKPTLTRSLSWTTHLLIKGHLEIEYDPRVWEEVEVAVLSACNE